ncbi:MAG TPA: glycosyltransferase family 4 protein, partial [Planctomycetota bacterium]|nr:glycosyltransferase family 4 protein [Planctomycetota bacterium]
VAAFARARERRPDLTLKLAGGRLPENAAALIPLLNLEDAVEILPHVSREELRRLHRHASLFLIPSFQEGLCISGLEALACGVPVVSTRRGMLPEIVADGRTGILVEETAESFAAALVRLAKDEALRRRMAKSAREAATERFTLGAQAERVEAIYRWVLGEGPRPE